MYFAAPLKGFPLKLGTGAHGQKLEWWATEPRKKLDDIFTTHEHDGQTGEHWATAKIEGAKIGCLSVFCFSRSKSGGQFVREGYILMCHSLCVDFDSVFTVFFSEVIALSEALVSRYFRH